MMIYTAMGDSVTSGENATSPGRAYPNLIVSRLRSRSVSACGQILSRPGWTSAALAAALQDYDPLPLHRSTVISIMIGGDDLAFAGLAMLRNPGAANLRSAISGYGRNMAVIAAMIRRSSKARIVLCTQYNPFPNSPLAVQGVNALNLTMELVARRFNAGLAPVHAWFEGKQAALISGYRTGKIEDALSGSLPIHPNNRGHEVIAQVLLPFIM